MDPTAAWTNTNAVLRCVYTCTVNILCLEPISHCRLNKYTHNGYSCVPLRLQQVSHGKKTRAARSLVYGSLNKYTQAAHMCSSLSLQLVLYSSWSKHTLAAQMCSFLSTACVPSYFPCKLNPLKHHSHLQPCSFRYLTPVQICLEFKMILPNTFHQSGPLPLFGKYWKETETPQS